MNHNIDNWNYITVVSALLLVVAGLSGCTDTCETKNTYVYYEPVYTPLAEVRTAVGSQPAKEIAQTGKIYFSNGFLFINEPNHGVHVIDNSEPSNPQNLSFINIPGSFDIAVRGNVLYADSYIDLVAMDISDIHEVKEIGRIEGLFQEYNTYGYYANAEEVITDWVEKENVSIQQSECETHSDWNMYYDGIAVDSRIEFAADMAIAPGNPGMAGSMARFALVGDYLYALDMQDLYPVNIGQPSNMLSGDRVTINWGIETIFPKGSHLFIGSQDGMYIMDVSNPAVPEWISSYSHVSSCDPVVVDDNYAYVTLRSGTRCQGFTNQLEVIDISDISNPELLYTYDMHNPHGLGKDGNVLFYM